MGEAIFAEPCPNTDSHRFRFGRSLLRPVHITMLLVFMSDLINSVRFDRFCNFVSFRRNRLRPEELAWERSISFCVTLFGGGWRGGGDTSFTSPFTPFASSFGSSLVFNTHFAAPPHARTVCLQRLLVDPFLSLNCFFAVVVRSQPNAKRFEKLFTPNATLTDRLPKPAVAFVFFVCRRLTLQSNILPASQTERLSETFPFFPFQTFELHPRAETIAGT